ncbi:MAG: ABC transporter permease [Desulfobacterium sp.]|nr:ABC transporter permease [Desulfobacterium sp.]
MWRTLYQGKRSLKSINNFMEKVSRANWVNLLFDREQPGFRYEILGMVLFVFVWIVACTLFFSDPKFESFYGFLPLPTLKALFLAATEGRFWVSVWASLRRVLTGITIAAAIGIPGGMMIGFYPKLRSLSYSPIQFLRMISPLSWMPVALLVFASFESAINFLIVMATVWPIMLNTAIGVMSVDTRLVRMALNQGATHLQLIRTIIVPASLPNVMASLRLALGVAWIVLVPAEFLGVSSGLGYLINDARDTMSYDRLMAMIIAIGILGFLLDRGLQKIQRLVSWSWVE